MTTIHQGKLRVDQLVKKLFAFDDTLTFSTVLTKPLRLV
jgi:hypothetical protein